MAIDLKIQKLIKEHPFFLGLDPHSLPILADVVEQKSVDAQTRMAKEGEPAWGFFLIEKGHVAIEMYVPKKGELILETVGPGDVFGWSWIFPPYRWTFDARAIEPTQVLAFNGEELRQKCDENPKFGYDLMKRFARIMSHRIHASRLQLLDLYGHPGHHNEGSHGR